MNNNIQQKLKEMRNLSKNSKTKLKRTSEPRFRTPYSSRTKLEIQDDMLESYQYARNWIPFADHNSTQRNNMTMLQEKAIVVPLHTEVPLVSSSMSMDMFEKSSIVKRLRGNITKLGEVSYQSQRIIVYKHNDKIYLMDTDGIHDNKSYMVYTKTDLDLLEPNVEYNINSDDDNFTLHYPHCYDPTSSTMTRGNNFLTLLDINPKCEGDSIIVSESFCNKTVFARVAKISIDLKDKCIISKYPKIFPELKTFIKDPVIFKIVEDEGDITRLTQTHDVPVTEEESKIIVHPNSYINKIRVISNEPIDNPILEEYRQEYLKFRRSVYSMLNKIVSTNKGKCDSKVLRYLENFKYDKLRTTDKLITSTLITMDIVTFVKPTVGSKLTNSHGAKGTIQEIYKDGTYVDKATGRNIDMVFSSLTFVNRTIMGYNNEHFISAVMYSFTNAAKKMKPEVAYKHFINLMQLITNAPGDTPIDWTKKITPEELNSLVHKYECLPVAILPWSSDMSLKRSSEIRKYAMKHFGLDTSTVIVNREEVGQPVELLSKHLLGYVHMFIDHHDYQFANSSASEPEVNTKGLPKDNADDKPNLRTLRKKQPCKEDVQLTYNLVGLVLNQDLKNAVVTDNNLVYIVGEQLRSIGADVRFEYDNKD